VLAGDLTKDVLRHLTDVSKEIYMPLLCNPRNQQNWSEIVAKDVMERLHTFMANLQITVGQVDGYTRLPLPPVEDLDPTFRYTTNKERVHVLEGCLVTWTRQIKVVLKQDPEQLLKRGQHPGPISEIQFWRQQSTDLNAIFRQLQSEQVRAVLQHLDQAKSTYNMPFAKLCKEVFGARAEANDNLRYLRPLESWFERLEQASLDTLTDLFRPITHMLLLVWNNSRFYNTPNRLVVMVREICNELIKHAVKYINGEAIFTFIEDEEAHRARDMIKTILQVCGQFKHTYFDYKAKANLECPTNPWRIQNNALFVRLDAFLERCHDILDLTETVVQFSKLGKLEVGGTKGKTLSTSVQQIYADFEGAINAFRSVGYDIMDLEVKRFDDDFYEFRVTSKELERRLASVLNQGFEDATTIGGKFKLLDSFEGLLERPIIADELEKKQMSLISAYSEDLHSMQKLFLEKRESPPIPSNMPPTAGKCICLFTPPTTRLPTFYLLYQLHEV
jgi:dynein heavy chain